MPPFRYLLRSAVLLALVSGCSHSSHRFQDANMDFGSVKTVAVLPFVNLSRDNLAGERVRDVLANTLLATGAVYVLPQGEVIRGLGKAGVASPTAPSVEEVVKLGQTLKVDAILSGVVKEYGEVRSGSASGNVISMSVQMQETATGKVVFAASTTQGGLKFKDRLFGGGGEPLNNVTEAAVNDVVDKLLK